MALNPFNSYPSQTSSGPPSVGPSPMSSMTGMTPRSRPAVAPGAPGAGALMALTKPRDLQTPQKAGELLEEIAKQWEQGQVMDDLAAYVEMCFQDARRHKMNAGVDVETMRCWRAINNQYDPEDVALLGGIDVFIGLTNLKSRALKSWLTDILTNSEDAPWTLKSTPLPELPEEAEEAVIDALMRELQQYGDSVDIRDRAKAFKDLALQHASKIAGETVQRMELAIKDNMLDGGWHTSFAEFIADLSTFQNAIMKGPILARVPSLRWSGDVMQNVDRLRYTMQRVHPLDMFPSPNSTNPQNGSYIIERKRIFPDDLNAMKTVPGFSAEAIDKLMADRPDGVREIQYTDTERARLESTDQKAYSSTDKMYDTYIYFGKLQGKWLQKHGVDGISDPFKFYEAEVWACGHVVIKAIMNPHPTGLRPYYTSSFEMVPGSFWGRGLPTLLRATQRICNASARSLVRNMAFASGPLGEYDVDRLSGETNIDEIRPFRMYAVTTDPFSQSNQSAIRFSKIDSHAEELLKVYDHFSVVADDIIGMPRYTLGSAETSGGGRTLGGLSMLMGNAARGVKHIITNMDKHLIEPVVGCYYTLMMMFHPDASIKADASVIARGSSGLLQRELQQSRALEVLQTITPYVQSGLVPTTGLLIVLRDVLRGLGYDSDDIVPDPARQAKLMETHQQNAVASAGPKPGANSEGSQPKLDNRSAPALQTAGATKPLPASSP